LGKVRVRVETQREGRHKKKEGLNGQGGRGRENTVNGTSKSRVGGVRLLGKGTSRKNGKKKEKKKTETRKEKKRISSVGRKKGGLGGAGPNEGNPGRREPIIM